MDGEPNGVLAALTVRPGPHLAGGGAMPPVVRCLALLGAILADLPGARGVVWHPARTLCSPDYFRCAVMRWIEGGVFPGFGLTALATLDDGSLQSEGLVLFAGKELRILGDVASTPADMAKVGLRLLHWLVANGGLEEEVPLTGPSGESLYMRPLVKEGVFEVGRSG